MEIISTRLMGGLGNMMFQIATAHSISIRDNKKMICDTKDMLIPHKSYTFYLENIFKKISFSDTLMNQSLVGEGGFHYSPIPKIDGNVKLVGYFQSEKYFMNYKTEILKLFEINDTTKNYLLEKYGVIINQDTCSIHIRRGDYLGLPTHHPTQSIDYYKNAIQIVGEKKHFLVFSDDIEWCKENIKGVNVYYSHYEDEVFDLSLIKNCDNNINANSSFSWWGSWLNKNKNKKIICPKIWFSEKANINDSDLIPKEWIRI